MTPDAGHIVDQIDDLVLGFLDPEEEAAGRSHAERCLDCATALGEATRAYQLQALALPAVPPGPALHDRLLASAAGSPRLGHFVQRVSELIQLPRDRVAGLVQAIDDPASWEDGPCPGVLLYHLPAGPQLADAVVGFVRLGGGTPFPEHSHLGEETVLVLQGSARDSSGAILRPGDEVLSAAGTSHHFETLPGPDFVYLVVVQEGVDFGCGQVIRAGDPRM